MQMYGVQSAVDQSRQEMGRGAGRDRARVLIDHWAKQDPARTSAIEAHLKALT